MPASHQASLQPLIMCSIGEISRIAQLRTELPEPDRQALVPAFTTRIDNPGRGEHRPYHSQLHDILRWRELRSAGR
jgi:hypothetical protein